jgi:hypothetical protein
MESSIGSTFLFLGSVIFAEVNKILISRVVGNHSIFPTAPFYYASGGCMNCTKLNFKFPLCIS